MFRSLQSSGPEETFLLTFALLDKLKVAAPELNKLDKKERDDASEKTNPSAKEYARIIDKEPRAKAILGKHGFEQP